MSENWKRGDIALVNGDVCLYRGDGRWEHGREDRFAYHAGESARRLVVIDPEDREQVERLHTLWCEAIVSKWTSSRQIDSLIAALREFANPTPPKPEEPTGLGAVVEDAEGRKWIHAPRDSRCNWHCQELGPTKWDVISVVRVLSEGVTP